MFSIIKNYIIKNTGILIRLDDIAENMNWDSMDKVEQLFDKYKIKPVLGVIPDNKDNELLSYPKKNNFWSKVKDWEDKGWEIAMHGLTHVYDTDTKKKDFFRYGGMSEFYGLSLEAQTLKIKNGLKKFQEKNIKIKCFFAPNHTYDKNTFSALKANNIKNIIDGYGIMPFEKEQLNFFPQLFYKEILLPFGIQSTQIHLNYWKEKDFLNFEKFIIKNKSKIISFDQALSKVNNGSVYQFINWFVEKTLKIMRKF